jgi:MFS family permease
MTESKKIHHAWLVFIGVCMMMAGGMGLVLNVMGNYFVPMATQFGLVTAEGKVDVTQVTLLMTVYSYVMLVWLPFAGRLFDRIDARLLFGAAGALLAIGVALMGVWTQVWQIYISGVLFGLAGPMIFLVGPSVLINNWFAPKQAGKFLGIASAFTGVGTFVWSPLFTSFISTMGYQQSFFIEAAVCAVLVLVPALFLFRTRPEDMGLQQFGIEKEIADGEGAVRKKGLSGKFALGTVAFYCIFVAACLISLGGGYKSMMSTAVQSIGGTDLAMLGASMISAAAVGNILGKISLGALADKIGIKVSMIAFAALNVVGFVIMVLMLGNNQAAMLIAGFCIGTGDAMMSVGLPILTRACYGDRDYAKIYSYLNMGIAILGGLGATFVAFVAKMAGGYQVAYGCGIVFEVVIAVAVIIAVTTALRFKDRWTFEGEPEKTRR